MFRGTEPFLIIPDEAAAPAVTCFKNFHVPCDIAASVAHVIKDGYRKALGRKKIDEVELNYTVRFLCYGSYSIMREWIARNREESPEMIAQMVLNLSMGSGAAQTGK